MNIAVVFAGGVGKRMKSGGKPKQFLELEGKAIIIHTLQYFEEHEEIDAIAIACVKEWSDYLKGLIERYEITKVRWIVPGGETGQLSIYNALTSIAADAPGDSTVLIHDGVRPLISNQLISDNIAGVKRYRTAITTYPTIETSIVSHDGDLVEDVLDRPSTYIAQAPQSFVLSELITCHEKALAEKKYDFIDSCSLYRYYFGPVHMVTGSRSNIKVTTPEDFYIFEALYKLHKNEEVRGATDV